jgi:regulator of cell morphogenesis and NO signaling
MQTPELTPTTTAAATTIDHSSTVAQIVLHHPETAAVFQRHRIDYCCRGNVTVAQACAGLNEDPKALFAELERAVRERAVERTEESLLDLSTPALLARIVDRHHGYLRRVLPQITPLLAKVAAVHGEHNRKLEGLREEFAELREALEPHLDFEEEVLFPELASSKALSAAASEHLEAMNQEHLDVGTKLARIRNLADDFTTPPWGCSSYRALMAALEDLEADVLKHVHLENHVLMPRFAGQKSLCC